MSVVCPDGHTSNSTDYCDVCGLPIGATAVAPAPSVPSPSAPPASSLDLAPVAAATPAAVQSCPNCGAVAPADALFCEDCGLDFTTGALPPPADPGTGPLPTTGPAVGAGEDGPPTALDPVAAAPGPPPAHPAHPAHPAPAADTAGPVEWVAEVWVDPDWHATQDGDEPCPSPGMPAVVPLRGRSQLVGRRSVSRNITPQVDVGADTGVSRRHAQLSTDGQRWWVEDLQSSNGTFVGAAGSALPGVPVPTGQRVEFTLADRIYVGAWTRLVVRRATPDER